MSLQSSTLQLLRFHFSFFLMPVFWFALSQVKFPDTNDTILVFVILHLLVYPSSNGYNSYMDRDTSSIGGLQNPAQPTRQLFYVTILMDFIAIAASIFISWIFFTGIIIYILASRAYSYRGIRLKKYPFTGYFTVMICQGALVFFLVMHGCSNDKPTNIPALGMISGALLIGGFYPLTQIYQHKEDKKDGVRTLSYVLGYTGTFIFTGIVYALAMTSIGLYLNQSGDIGSFYILQIFFLPVIVYFGWWFYKVYKSKENATFIYTMRMNMIASFFSNAAFIYLFVTNRI